MPTLMGGCIMADLLIWVLVLAADNWVALLPWAVLVITAALDQP
jgi:hypothetical protein